MYAFKNDWKEQSMSKKVIYGVFTIIVLLVISFFGAKIYINKKVSEKIDKKIEEIKPYADVSYRSVDYSLLRNQLTISGIKVLYAGSRYPVTINRVVISDFDREHDFPLFALVKVKGITFYVNSLPEEDRLILKALGYGDRMSADFSSSYRYDMEKRKLTISDLTYHLKDIGTLSLKFNFGNVRPVREEEVLYFLLDGWGEISIYNGEISYSDEGLFNRVITLIAAERHISQDQVKAALIKQIKNELNGDPVSEMLAKAFVDFILDPGTLKITVNPEKPVTIAEIIAEDSVDNILQRLNLKVENVH